MKSQPGSTILFLGAILFLFLGPRFLSRWRLEWGSGRHGNKHSKTYANTNANTCQHYYSSWCLLNNNFFVRFFVQFFVQFFVRLLCPILLSDFLSDFMSDFLPDIFVRHVLVRFFSDFLIRFHVRFFPIFVRFSMSDFLCPIFLSDLFMSDFLWPILLSYFCPIYFIRRVYVRFFVLFSLSDFCPIRCLVFLSDFLSPFFGRFVVTFFVWFLFKKDGTCLVMYCHLCHVLSMC